MVVAKKEVTLDSILGRSHDNEDSVTHVRNSGSLIERTRIGMFAVLYLTYKNDTNTTASQSKFNIFINTCQLLYFSVHPAGMYLWPDEVEQYLQPFFGLFTFAFIKNLGQGAVKFSLVLVMLSMVIAIASTVYIAISFSSASGVKQLWILHPLKAFLTSASTFLYVPILTVLSQAFYCDNFDIDSCQGNGQFAFRVITGVVMVAFVAFTCLTVLVLVDRTPNKLNMRAKAHGRADCISLLCRATLLAMYVRFDQRMVDADLSGNDTIRLVMGLIVLSSAWVMMASSYYYLPYYNADTNQQMLGCYGVVLWSAFCLVGLHVLYEQELEFVSLVFVSAATPAMYYCGQRLYFHRVESLIKMAAIPHCSAYLTELRLRYQHPFESTDNSTLIDVYRAALQEVNPDSGYLTVHTGLLFLNVIDNPVLANQLLKSAKDLVLDIEHSFVLFKYNLEKGQNKDGTSGAISYMVFDYHVREAENNVKESINNIINFWKMLKKSRSPTTAFKSGDAVRKSSDSAKYHLDKLLAVSHGSSRSLRLYASYLEFVFNDKWTAYELLTKADEIDQQEQRGSEGDEMGMMFKPNSSSMVLTVGMTEKNHNMILNISELLSDKLGYPPDELMNRSLNTLCPSPIAEVHEKILKKYMMSDNTAESRKMPIWVLHRDGYVLPCVLQSNLVTDEEGEYILNGMFNFTEDATVDYCMLDTALHVKFGTSRFWYDIINRPPPLKSDTKAKTIAICDYLRELPPDFETLRGFSGLVESDSKTYDVTVEYKNYSCKLVGGEYDIELLLLKFTRQLGCSEVVSVASDGYDEEEVELLEDAQELARRQKRKSRSAELLQKITNAGNLNLNANNKVYPATRHPLIPSGSSRKLTFSVDSPGPKASRRVSVDTQEFEEPSLNPAQVHREEQGDNSTSYDTKSTASSTVSKEKVVFGKLQKRIQQKNRRKTTYAQFLVVMSVICFLTGISNIFIHGYFYGLYHEAVVEVKASFERSLLIFETVLATSLFLENERHHVNVSLYAGYSDPDYIAADAAFRLEVEEVVTGLVEEMEGNVVSLEEIHIHLSESEAATYEPITALNAVPSITLLDSSLGKRRSTLWVAVHEFVAASKQVVASLKNRNETAFECAAECQFILNNGPYSMFAAANHMTDLFYDAAILALETNDVDSTVIGFCIASLFVFLFFYIVVRYAVELFDSNKRVGEALLVVPDATIDYMISTAQSNMRRLMTSIDADEEDDLQLEHAEGGDGLPAVNTSLKQSESKRAEERRLKKIRKSEDANENSSAAKLAYVVRNSLKFGAANLFAILFFSTSSTIIGAITPDPAVQASNVYLSGKRMLVVQELETLQFTQWNVPEWHTMYGRVRDKFDFMLELEQELLHVNAELQFGSEDYGTVATVSKTSNPELFALLYEDACMSLCQEGEQLQVAPKYTEVLRHGLHPAVLFFEAEMLHALEVLNETAHGDFDNGNLRVESPPLTILEKDDDRRGSKFVLEAIHHHLQLAEDSAREFVETQSFDDRIFFIIFFTFMLVLGMFSYRSYCHMNDKVQHAQFLMLMIPPEVLLSTPQLLKVLNH